MPFIIISILFLKTSLTPKYHWSDTTHTFNIFKQPFYALCFIKHIQYHYIQYHLYVVCVGMSVERSKMWINK